MPATIRNPRRNPATALILGAFLIAGQQGTAAAEASGADTLKQRIEELERRNSEYLNALRALTARLQQLEARTALMAPAAAPKPAAATPPAQPTPPKRAVASTPEERDATPDKPAATQEEATVRTPAHSRAVQTVVETEHAAFDRKLTVEAGMSYSRSDRKQLVLSGFYALDAIFLGTIKVDEVAADIFTFDLGARYGLSPRLQLSATAPFLYRNTTYTKTSTSNTTSEAEVSLSGELGDAAFGLSYQLLPESADWPDIVLNLQAKAPTGSHPYGIPNTTITLDNGTPADTSDDTQMIVPERLPSGNGVWSLSAGLSFLRTADPVVLFGSLTYIHNFTRGFDDLDTAPATATPGEVDLGDAFQYSLGMAIALNERTSMSLSFSQRLSQTARTRLAGGAWADITGSDANAASLNFGATYALSDRMSLVANIGAGLTPDAPDLTVSLRLPYTF